MKLPFILKVLHIVSIKVLNGGRVTQLTLVKSFFFFFVRNQPVQHNFYIDIAFLVLFIHINEKFSVFFSNVEET